MNKNKKTLSLEKMKVYDIRTFVCDMKINKTGK